MTNPLQGYKATDATQATIDEFYRHGFIVRRGLLALSCIDDLLRLAQSELHTRHEPIEYESELGYPGAPAAREDPGGDTPRRLLCATARREAFVGIAKDEKIATLCRDLIGCSQLQVSQNHHNCIMTKFPGYSSATHWHRDIRYWSFEREELISVWIPLVEETAANGALKVLTGSHRLDIRPSRLDRMGFLRQELTSNAELIDNAIQLELSPGDVLFFHCRLFHAAQQNETNSIKYSLVFTYHDAENRSVVGTRSARLAPIDCL